MNSPEFCHKGFVLKRSFALSLLVSVILSEDRRLTLAAAAVRCGAALNSEHVGPSLTPRRFGGAKSPSHSSRV